MMAPVGVDHDAKAPVCGEEGQAMPAIVGIDPALGKARDLARAHFLLKPGQRKAEPIGDDGRVDLHGAVLEFDRFHAVHLVGVITRAPGFVWMARDRRIPQAWWRRARA